MVEAKLYDIKSLNKEYYPSRYGITKGGRIFRYAGMSYGGHRLKGKWLSTFISSSRSAYMVVGIRGGQRYVHRLLGEAFIPNPENKPQINHIDGDKSNNNLSNLEWVTLSEQRKHAWDNGLMENARLSMSRNKKNRIKNDYEKHVNGIKRLYDSIKDSLRDTVASNRLKKRVLNNMNLTDIANEEGVTCEAIRFSVTKECKELGINYSHIKSMCKKHHPTV